MTASVEPGRTRRDPRPLAAGQPWLPDPVPLLLLSWTLLSLAISVLNGAYRTKAFWPLSAAFGVLLLAVGCLRRRRQPIAAGAWTRSPTPALGAAIGAGLAVPLAYDVGLYGTGTALVASRSLSVAAAALLAGAAAWPAVRRALAALSAATGALAMVLMIHASPRPAIDVWFILTVGSRRLLDGQNVFTSCWPGNTDRLTDCVYPYGPMTTVLQTPFRLAFGDVRFSYVVALLLAAGLLWRLAGPVWGPLLGPLVLVSPKIAFLVEQSWTEPLLLAGIATMVLAVISGRPWLAVLALGLALACKQHVLLLVPLAAAWPAFGPRRTLVSVLGAGIATLPWFLADPRAFLDDALWFNLDLTPRRDSLSAFTALTNAGHEPAFWMVAAVSLFAVVAAVCLLPRNAVGFTAGAAFVQFVFDYANKQSFFNHWWFVSGLLLLAVAVLVRDEDLPAPAREPADGESRTAD